MLLIADSGCNFDIGLDLAFGGKCQRLGHILAITDEGAADGDAVGHDVKKRNGKSPGGNPTRTQVPRLRVMPTPCLNAPSEGAVISTPCAPPSVPFLPRPPGRPFWR